ncbi:hypothetical protein, partial [Candidatus Erwinia dacicola]|uniref:hypothetical protein n=1 Tax=Candidatus Erwinia dacicola TaxID=252393 RepID=UPI001C9BED3F
SLHLYDRALHLLSEFAIRKPTHGRRIKGILVEAFTLPLFDVEPFLLSEMFSLHATGSPVEPER